MPRAEQSPVSKIIGFFRTSQLETATLVLDLCKDALRERLNKSAQAKARAAAPAPAATETVTPAAPAVKGAKKTAKGKKGKKGKKVQGPVAVPAGESEPVLEFPEPAPEDASIEGEPEPEYDITDELVSQ